MIKKCFCQSSKYSYSINSNTSAIFAAESNEIYVCNGDVRLIKGKLFYAKIQSVCKCCYRSHILWWPVLGNVLLTKKEFEESIETLKEDE